MIFVGETKDVFKTLDSVEKKIANCYKGLDRYKIYDLFRQIRDLISYREIKPFVDVSEDGKSFRCQKCHTLINCEDSTSESFEFCPICGQRVAPEGTYLNYILKGD